MALDLHGYPDDAAHRGVGPDLAGAQLLDDPLPDALDAAERWWLDEEASADSAQHTPGHPEPGGPAGWTLAAQTSLVDLEASEIAELLPGGELALLLEGLDPRAASDVVLVEASAVAQRLVSWLHHRATTIAGELSRRDSMNPVWSAAAGGAPSVSDVAGDELAMRLACSRRTGRALVREGRAYDGPLVATGDALARGALGPAHARYLVERLETVALPVALEVEDRVLPGAERRTLSQWRGDVERALIAVDPADAAARHTRARRGRRIDHPRPLPDGMAGMWAVLPAVDALRIDGVLDAAARSARSTGDPRTLDELRADGLVDLVLNEASLTTGSGFATGSGLPTAGSTLVEDGTAVIDAPTAESVADSRSAERSAAPGDAHRLAASTPPTGAPVRQRGSRTVIRVNVTVGLPTLLGQDDAPAEVAGFGPVDAVTARALAAGGVWRRLVTDPLSGTVLDVGRSRYRPPADMVDHVVARDETCARPGCSTPAHACDLDHTVEFNGPDHGETAADNLGPLCRRDHRLKTDGGSRLAQISPGEYVWISPAGLYYRVVPGDHGYSEILSPDSATARSGNEIAHSRSEIARSGNDAVGARRGDHQRGSRPPLPPRASRPREEPSSPPF